MRKICPSTGLSKYCRMLAFFLHDPADKVQRADDKLVQLQVAMRYHLLETRYWANYVNGKT